MKKTFSVILLLLGSINLLSCQQTVVSEQSGFSMQAPKDWLVANNTELVDNLNKFEMTNENLAKILKDNERSVLLTAFTKYDPKTRSGLIPTVQVNVRANNTKDFQEFKSLIIQSLEGIKQHFEEYELIEEPKEVDISGIKSVLIISNFSMKGKGGQIVKVRSRTYAIPRENDFFQVNFTDGQVEEDCSTEFDELVKTIRIGK